MADEVRLELSACAKLNLFLHVVGRRPDGYHELQTVFRLIDLCDRVVLESAPPGVVELLPGSDAPGGEDDLTLRAARLLRRSAGVRRGARIGLTKTIPAGGGLGGGSSDAAVVLLGLSRLWGLDLPLADLAELGLALGADVPVFVHGRNAWAEGVGERLTPLPVEPDIYLVCDPGEAVATGRVFADPELTRSTPVIRIPARFSRGGRNDCAAVVARLHPRVGNTLAWLSGFGDARLTGTGGCVFLACPDAAAAERIAAQAPDGVRTFVAAGLDVAPSHRALGL